MEENKTASTTFTPRNVLLAAGATAAVVGLGYYLFFKKDSQRLRRKNLQEAHTSFVKAAKLQLEDPEEAAKELLKAIELLSKHLGPHDENVAKCYQELAHCCLAFESFEDAEVNLRNCLEIREHNNGENAPILCETLLMLANILNAVEKYEEAEKHALRALQIYKSEDHNLDGCSHAHSVLANIYLTAKQAAKAEAAAEMALGTLKEHMKAKPKAKSESGGKTGRKSVVEKLYQRYSLLAQAKVANAKYDEAEDAYQQLLNKVKEILGEGDLAVALILRSIASFYEERDRIEDAEEKLLESLALIEKKFGVDHSNYFDAANCLAHFYWQTNRAEKAQQIHDTLKSKRGAAVLPSMTSSKYLETKAMTFTFVRAKGDSESIEPVYVCELRRTEKLPERCFLEFEFENPATPSQPRVSTVCLPDPDQPKGFLFKISDPIRGAKQGELYELVIRIYADESKTTFIGEHHQLCKSPMDTDKFRTVTDLSNLQHP
ncbi:hypothetical protein QOT17_012360 [Balamuthia mandrillaris]